jgi:hypothetical protein
LLDFQIYLISPALRALPAASPTAAQHRRAMPPRATASSTVTPTALPPPSRGHCRIPQPCPLSRHAAKGIADAKRRWLRR